MKNWILAAAIWVTMPSLSFGAQMLAFDWDGNLAALTTKVVLFSTTDGSEKIITGQDFAKARFEIDAAYPGFEIRTNRQNPEISSFRYTDAIDQNYFLLSLQEHVVDAVNADWQSKQWARFIAALDNPRTRPFVSIITSRGHSPEHVLEGLEHLRRLGWLQHLPLLKNIHTVSYKFGEFAHLDSISAKTQVIAKQLDELSSDPSSRHYYEFSDDTDAYVKAIKTFLALEKMKGRWPAVDIVITHTQGARETSWLMDQFVTPVADKDLRFKLFNCESSVVTQ